MWTLNVSLYVFKLIHLRQLSKYVKSFPMPEINVDTRSVFDIQGSTNAPINFYWKVIETSG